jgi:hypothetical protein
VSLFRRVLDLVRRHVGIQRFVDHGSFDLLDLRHHVWLESVEKGEVSVGCGGGKLAYSKKHSERVSVWWRVLDGRTAAKVELVSTPFTMSFH